MTDRIIERFAEAVVTGEHCGTSDAGPRRFAALSLGGLGLLTGHEIWPEAMRRVIGLEAHPRAQERFLKAWQRVAMGGIRTLTGDDDVFFAALRVLLPAYTGPAVHLFRGQVATEPVGVCWTRSFRIALKFALYSWNNVDPNNLEAAQENGAVLDAEVPAGNIICAPCLLGYLEGEYVVDPRGLSIRTMHTGAGMAASGA